MEIKELVKKVCNRETIMYLIFGVLTTLVTLIVFYVLTSTLFNLEKPLLDPDNAIQLQLANIISWTAGLIFAYFTNRKYVFESKETNQVKEATKFVASRLSTLLLDMLVMFVGVTVLKGNEKIIKLISQVLVIISNYLLSKLFVFKKNKEQND